MKPELGLLCGVLLVALPAAAQSKPDQDTKKDNAQIVKTAEILKIDAKKKSLQVREIVESNSTSAPDQDSGRRRYPDGGDPGGQRRQGGQYPGGGVGFPGGGGGGGGRYPGDGQGRYPGRNGG